MNLLETNRLTIGKLTTEDAPFIFELVNSPAWIRFIGDKSVKTLEDARSYITNGPIKSYVTFGFGLYLVKLKEKNTSIGICGLIKRDTLENVDIGFAFLPEFTGRGYAFESVTAVLEYGKTKLALDRVVAITNDDNHHCINLLQKSGLLFEKRIKLANDEKELLLFATKM